MCMWHAASCKSTHNASDGDAIEAESQLTLELNNGKGAEVFFSTSHHAAKHTPSRLPSA